MIDLELGFSVDVGIKAKEGLSVEGEACSYEKLVDFFTVRVMGGALDQDVMDAFNSCTSLSAAGVGSNVNTV